MKNDMRIPRGIRVGIFAAAFAACVLLAHNTALIRRSAAAAATDADTGRNLNIPAGYDGDWWTVHNPKQFEEAFTKDKPYAKIRLGCNIEFERDDYGANFNGSVTELTVDGGGHYMRVLDGRGHGVTTQLLHFAGSDDHIKAFTLKNVTLFTNGERGAVRNDSGPEKVIFDNVTLVGPAGCDASGRGREIVMRDTRAFLTYRTDKIGRYATLKDGKIPEFVREALDKYGMAYSEMFSGYRADGGGAAHASEMFAANMITVDGTKNLIYKVKSSYGDGFEDGDCIFYNWYGGDSSPYAFTVEEGAGLKIFDGSYNSEYWNGLFAMDIDGNYLGVTVKRGGKLLYSSYEDGGGVVTDYLTKGTGRKIRLFDIQPGAAAIFDMKANPEGMSGRGYMLADTVNIGQGARFDYIVDFGAQNDGADNGGDRASLLEVSRLNIAQGAIVNVAAKNNDRASGALDKAVLFAGTTPALDVDGAEHVLISGGGGAAVFAETVTDFRIKTAGNVSIWSRGEPQTIGEDTQEGDRGYCVVGEPSAVYPVDNADLRGSTDRNDHNRIVASADIAPAFSLAPGAAADLSLISSLQIGAGRDSGSRDTPAKVEVKYVALDGRGDPVGTGSLGYITGARGEHVSYVPPATVAVDDMPASNFILDCVGTADQTGFAAIGALVYDSAGTAQVQLKMPDSEAVGVLPVVYALDDRTIDGQTAARDEANGIPDYLESLAADQGAEGPPAAWHTPPAPPPEPGHAPGTEPVTVPGTGDVSPDPAGPPVPSVPENGGTVAVPGTDGSPPSGSAHIGPPAGSAAPPEPNRPLPSPAAGGALVTADGGATYHEIGTDGVPLGVWHYDDGAQAWIFDPLHTPGAVPPTSDGIRSAAALATFAVSSLVTAALALSKARQKE
jgi:hypothetical protein